jgi:hypothetical protein
VDAALEVRTRNFSGHPVFDQGASEFTFGFWVQRFVNTVARARSKTQAREK